jgi:transposase
VGAPDARVARGLIEASNFRTGFVRVARPNSSGEDLRDRGSRSTWTSVNKSTSRASSGRRGSVVEVARELLAEGRTDEMLSLVTQLAVLNGELATRAAQDATDAAAAIAREQAAAAREQAAAARVAELEQRLEKLLARYKKSEAVSKAQLVLFLDAISRGEAGDLLTDPEDPRSEASTRLRDLSKIEEDEDEPRTKAPRERPPTRQPAPAHLRRVPNPIEVPLAERPCPRCGVERTCIGHDVTEVIELIPAQVIVRQDQREKLACLHCEGELVRAPVGDKVVVGGKLGNGLVIDMLVGKYGDGLPLHRQRERYARLGLLISVSTLVDQIAWITELLRPLWRAALAECIASKVMHLDGTGLSVLDRDAAGGKRLGTLWGYVGDEAAAYVYASTGKSVGQKPGEMGPQDILALRKGPTVADASSVFEASFEENPDLLECGCNTHARRYFVKALDAGDQRAALPLAAYKRLYKIEEEIRGLAPEAKLEARQKQSKPVFEELASWAETHQPYEPPASKLGAAIRYLLNHRVALGRFLESGLIPIDNGAVERLHVRTALTRKNFLFAGSDAGGERAAIAYTILSCCRINGVNPIEYLTDVLPKLTGRIRLMDLPALLPAPWKASRAAAALAASAT